MPVPTQALFDAFSNAPAQFASILQELTETQIQYVPATGEWSIHMIIVHLADSEAVGYWRLRKTIAEPGSTLAIYDEAAWAERLSYQTQNRESALAIFAALRASNAALLRSLPDEMWALSSTHPERGALSLYDLFQIYLEHGQIHLQQIEQIKRRLHLQQ
jgi:hypothetical protein